LWTRRSARDREVDEHVWLIARFRQPLRAQNTPDRRRQILQEQRIIKLRAAALDLLCAKRKRAQPGRSLPSDEMAVI
jgi:hypothetical protein